MIINNSDIQTNTSHLAIDVHHLSKRFGPILAVQDLSLSIKTGEIFGFLGPNGSGKTTAIRMLCGLLTPDSGTGTCLGLDIRTNSYEIKKQVGYMPQQFSLYQELTIHENLNFMAKIYQIPNREETVKKVINHLGLEQRKNQLTGTLSGGWKQRLALACCLLHDPKLLLLDEPTAGVDPKARREFWDNIRELSTNNHITSLVSTHYMDEAEKCDRLGYIAYGKLFALGTPDQLLKKYHKKTLESVFVYLMRNESESP